MRWHLYTCQAFFNRNSDLVVVSVSALDNTTFKHHLQVGVADLKSKKWVGDFTVEPQRAFVPISVAGFLKESNSVVVTGALPGAAVDGTQHGSFASLLYDATGKQLVPTPTTRTNLGPSDGLSQAIPGPTLPTTGCGVFPAYYTQPLILNSRLAQSYLLPSSGMMRRRLSSTPPAMLPKELICGCSLRPLQPLMRVQF